MRKEALIGLSVLLVAVSGSATVLDSFGFISGEASVEPALEVEEIYYESNVSGQDSGEYILLRANTEVDLGEWELVDSDDKGGEFSGKYSGLVAIVDNTTNEAKFTKPSDTNVQIVNAGNLAGSGLSPSEDLYLNYIPEDTEIQSPQYNDPGCGDDEAFQVEQDDSGACEPALLSVEEVSAQ